MNLLPAALEELTSQISRLPGIGPKSAQKLAFHFANLTRSQVGSLTAALVKVTEELHPCARCFFIADAELCQLCQNPKRDQTLLAVVETNQDVIAIEASGEYSGLYHVLGGSLSPLDGVGPNDLHIRELLARLQGGSLKEVILAFDPDVEGDATAYYLHEELSKFDVLVTRIAYGISAGSGVQYSDAISLGRALRGRR